jgi:hypothetical protein
MHISPVAWPSPLDGRLTSGDPCHYPGWKALLAGHAQLRPSSKRLLARR